MRSLLDVSIRSGLLPASMLLMAVACQASKGGSTNHGSGANSQGARSSTGGSPSLGGSLSLTGGTTGVVDSYNGSLTSDAGDQITVEGEVVDVHLTLKADDGTTVTEGVTWSVDDTKIGSISGDGTFHANGYVGGEVTISATVGDGTISKKITVPACARSCGSPPSTSITSTPSTRAIRPFTCPGKSWRAATCAPLEPWRRASRTAALVSRAPTVAAVTAAKPRRAPTARRSWSACRRP